MKPKRRKSVTANGVQAPDVEVDNDGASGKKWKSALEPTMTKLPKLLGALAIILVIFPAIQTMNPAQLPVQRSLRSTKFVETEIVLDAPAVSASSKSAAASTAASLLATTASSAVGVRTVNAATGLSPTLLTTTTESSSSTTTTSTSSQQRLTCEGILNLEILRYVGRGKRKISFEVRLPSGEHALAKRCIHMSCHQQDAIQKEVKLLKKLEKQYGTEHTVGFYGGCNPQNGLRIQEFPGTWDELARNFSYGYTAVVELGNPLAGERLWVEDGSNRRNWKDKRRECFASFFTEADIEGFKTIARQYANLTSRGKGKSSSPMVMANPKELEATDNTKVEQYALTMAGMRHIDLDEMWKCKGCTYEEALEINCDVIRKVTHLEHLNCSEVKKSDTFPDLHINSTAAILHCSDPSQLEWKKN